MKHWFWKARSLKRSIQGKIGHHQRLRALSLGIKEEPQS